MQDDWLNDFLNTTTLHPTNTDSATHSAPKWETDAIADSLSPLTTAFDHPSDHNLTTHSLPPHPDAPSWHHYPTTMYSPSHTASTNSMAASGWDDGSAPNATAWDWTVGGLFAPHAAFDPAHPGSVVVGDPVAATTHWQPQHLADSCVSAVQSNMIAEQTGHLVPEGVLYVEAIADGVIQDQGTPAALAPVELHEHGVPAHVHVSGTIADLEMAVAHGESVMAAVNAQAIAQPDSSSLFAAFAQPSVSGPADHAVEVTGFIHSPQDGHLQAVVVNDPAIPQGAAEVVPIEQFQQAWATSQNFYVATEVHQPSQTPTVNLGGEQQGSLGGLDFALGGSGGSVEFSGNHIWQHYRNGHSSDVGYVENQKFYRWGEGYCGKLGSDWNIYDAHGDRVGYVDSNLDVRSPNGRLLGHADSALAGAAWLLFVGIGGLPYFCTSWGSVHHQGTKHTKEH